MVVNRVHAVLWPRPLIHAITGVSGLAIVCVPLAVLLWMPPDGIWSGSTGIWAYSLGGVLLAVFTGRQKLRALMNMNTSHGLIGNHTETVELTSELAVPLTSPGVVTWLASLPRNQLLKPQIHYKQVCIPRLPAAGDGIKIAHITDLHMSGRVQKAYFAWLVERVNEWQPDVVALTGDLVERASCLDWIEDTLARLRASGGVYFILGNHDRRVDCRQLRDLLSRAGHVDLGGRWQLAQIHGTSIVLAGNELPWFSPAADLTDAPNRGFDGLPLRIILSHSPDQLPWSIERDADLVLAGHNHGGQVCFPVVGPVLAPSLHGTRYAAGVFREGRTILHVSRGAASLAPFRWGCPPEIALLTLRSAAVTEFEHDGSGVAK
jgi:predicted MPP superfamily phosphohydrolase